MPRAAGLQPGLGGLLEFAGVEQRPGGQHLVVLGQRLGVAGVQARPLLLQRRGVVGVVGGVVGEGGPFGHRSVSSVSVVRQRAAVAPASACRWSRCAGFEVGQQQAQHVEGAAHQRRAGALGLERVARVAHVLVAQPVGQHHHHRGGHRGSTRAASIAHRAAARQAVEHRLHRARLVLQHELEVRLEPAVLRQQVVQVAVQEAVLPDQLEQHVEEQPGVLDVAHAVGGAQQLGQRASRSGRTAC